MRSNRAATDDFMLVCWYFGSQSERLLVNEVVLWQVDEYVDIVYHVTCIHIERKSGEFVFVE